jgi:hypothetical protein
VIGAAGFIATVFGPATNRSTTSPILIASPSAISTAPVIFCPSTRVPLRPKSRTYHLPSSKYTLAWRREASSSRSTRVLSRLRPRVTV